MGRQTMNGSADLRGHHISMAEMNDHHTQEHRSNPAKDFSANLHRNAVSATTHNTRYAALHLKYVGKGWIQMENQISRNGHIPPLVSSDLKEINVTT
jgi:hypothetical protein